MVQHKSKYSCKSTIYFDLDPEVIKDNCKLVFYNKTDITPKVLDGGHEIILAMWPNDKHIICNVNELNPLGSQYAGTAAGRHEIHILSLMQNSSQ